MGLLGMITKLAAGTGSAAAQLELGRSYEAGLGGLPQDDREAARYYKLSANLGNPTAQYALGTCNLEGRGGLPQDDREAARVPRQSGSESPSIRIRIRDRDVPIVFRLIVAGKR